MYLILGFTKRTSYSLSQFLGQQGHSLVIADRQKTNEQQELIKILSTKYDTIDELGNQDVSLLDRYDISQIFISPGVPRSIPLVKEALNRGIEIINDIEYFYRCFPDRTYVAITGTDGKTTVASWVGHVLSSQKPTVLAGNIGIPIFEYADDEYQNHIFVVELSSFQLESLDTFHPRVAVITNIQEDHLDRYDSMDDYANTKKNVFNNQTPHDLALINKNDDRIVSFIDDINATKKYFSYEEMCLDKVSGLKLVGTHNIQNALVVLGIAEFFDIKNIKDSLCSFYGVEHRLEFVKKYKGVSFYNDSKATTLQSLSTALNAFDEPVILLAGGQGKGLDYTAVASLVSQKSKKVFAFGEVRDELAEAWDEVEVCQTMKDAFDSACEYAKDGDVILLSPAATSFDEFDSFAHRGQIFKKLVQDYKK